MNSFVIGLVSVAAATIVWGLQFPVAADVFVKVDPFFITSIRYLLASSLLFLCLVIFLGVVWVFIIPEWLTKAARPITILFE